MSTTIFPHSQAVGFFDATAIAVVDILVDETVFHRFAQTVVDGSLAEPRSLIHATAVLATATLDEFIDGDVLLDPVFLIPPRMPQNVFDDFQLGDVVDLCGDIRPRIGHTEKIRLWPVESLECRSFALSSCHRWLRYRA